MKWERRKRECEPLNQTLRFREMTRADLPALTALYVETFNVAPWKDEWTEETALLRLERMLGDGGAYGLCAELDGVLCGGVLGVEEIHYRGPVFTVREFWVRNSLRGHGVGAKLFAELEDRLRDRGVCILSLLTLRGAATEHFYEKQGMKTNGAMVFMEKQL